MKLKIFLSLITLFVISLNTAIAKQKVKKKNGGTKGYDYVKETHGNGDHTLICKNPGREKCTWNQGTSITTLEQSTTIDTFIENELANGNYTGTGNLSNTNIWFYWAYNVGTGELIYTVSLDQPDYDL